MLWVGPVYTEYCSPVCWERFAKYHVASSQAHFILTKIFWGSLWHFIWQPVKCPFPIIFLFPSHFESGCYPNPSFAQKPLTHLRSHCWLLICHETFKFLPISLRFISVNACGMRRTVKISPMLASPILIFIIVVFNPLSVHLRPGWNWSVTVLCSEMHGR